MLENTSELFSALGVGIDGELLVTALTHRSFANENADCEHNERLEFLGDAILEYIISDEVYRRLGDAREGRMSEVRAAIVSEAPLARIAKSLKLGKMLLLGKGETKSGGNEKESLLSDALEAIFAAIYLTNGIDKTRTTILKLLSPVLDEVLADKGPLDYKGATQSLARSRGFGEVLYEFTEFGPDHAKKYCAKISFSETDLFHAEGIADSRKKASIEAAKNAYHKLSSINSAAKKYA